MKIRTSFVTNSSSSSFILGFTKEEDIEETIKKEFPSYYKDDISEMVISDIKSNIVTKEDALEKYRENIDTYYVSFKGKKVWDYDYKERYTKGTELYNFIKKYKKEQLLKFKDILNKYDTFSIVEYSDNDGELNSKLEHEIMPDLKCTIERLSHH